MVGCGDLLTCISIICHDRHWAVSCDLAHGNIATAYATMAGLSVVIWTDVLQFSLLAGGAIWVAIALTEGTPGGW